MRQNKVLVLVGIFTAANLCGMIPKTLPSRHLFSAEVRHTLQCLKEIAEKPTVESHEFISFKQQLSRELMDKRVPSTSGRTLLSIASSSGNAQIVTHLLECGARIDIPDEGTGYTPLHRACEAHHKDIVEVLLNKSTASVNVAARNGQTALHIACQNAFVTYCRGDIVRTLLSHGADQSIPDLANCTPSTIATRDNKTQLLALLQSHALQRQASINEQSKEHVPAARPSIFPPKQGLFNKSSEDHATPLRPSLLPSKQNLFSKSSDNITRSRSSRMASGKSAQEAVFLASCAQNEFEKAKNLLGKETQLKDAKNDQGKTALHLIASNGRNHRGTNLAEYLLAAGAPYDTLDEHGYTPLHYAVENNLKDLVNVLLRSNAKVNAQVQGTGDTPLHLAAKKRLHTVAALLRQTYRARNDLCNNENRRPADLVPRSSINDRELVKIIGSPSHSQSNTPVLPSPTDSHTSSTTNSPTRSPLESPQQPSSPGRPTSPALISLGRERIGASRRASGFSQQVTFEHLKEACQEENLAKITQSLENGAFPINRKFGSSEDTLLHVACNLGKNNVVVLLLSKKADPNIRNGAHETPLAVAAGLQPENTAIVADLLRNGAFEGLDGALKIARAKNNFSVLALLKAAPEKPMTGTAKSEEELFEELCNACKKGNITNIKALYAQKTPLDLPKKAQIDSPLHWACKFKHTACAQYLLEHGANCNAQNASGETPLHCACSTNNQALVVSLIRAGAQTSIADHEGQVALHRACLVGAHEIVDNLLTMDSDCSYSDKKGRTPLHYACLSASTFAPHAAMRLLRSGVNINARSDQGDTPLHYACRQKHFPFTLIALLVQNDAAVDITNNQDELAYELIDETVSNDPLCKEFFTLSPSLHCACMQGNKNAIQRKIYVKKEQLASQDAQGNTALHAALHGFLLLPSAEDPEYTLMREQYAEFIDWLIEVCANEDSEILSLKNGQSLSPLHIACIQGDLEVVEKLLKAGAEVNSTSARGFTPLFAACKYGQIAVVKLLLSDEYRADTSCKTQQHKQTALHIVCSEGYPSLATLLVQRGANIHAQTAGGLTPLHIASSNPNSINIVLFLIGLGADVNCKDSRGATPLHLAHSFGNEAIANKLKEAGASETAIDDGGQTPRSGRYHDTPHHLSGEELSSTSNYIPTRRITRSQAPVILSEITCEKFISACKEGNSQTVNDLLTQGLIDPNSVDNVGNSLLNLVCMHAPMTFNKANCKGTEIVRELLSRGAKIVSTRQEEWTPLHIAARRNLSILAELLLIEQANPKARDRSNQTPLHGASQNGSRATAKLLLTHGARVDARDDDDQTPLHLACLTGHLDLVELLVSKGANAHLHDLHNNTPLNNANIKGHNHIAYYLNKQLEKK